MFKNTLKCGIKNLNECEYELQQNLDQKLKSTKINAF